MRPCALRHAIVFAAALILTSSVFATPPGFDRSNADHNQLILRLDAGAAGDVAAQYGLDVLAAIPAPDGGDDVVLVAGPATVTASEIEGLLAGDPRIVDVDSVVLAALPGEDAAPPAADPALAAAFDADVAIDLAKTGTAAPPCLAQTAPGQWQGFLDQEAARLVRLAAAHAVVCGAAPTVAVIDTGVDPDHALLADALVVGYDFLSDEPGLPSEWDFLDQSVSPIVEHQLDQSVSPIVEQSVSPIVESWFREQAGPIGESLAEGDGELLMLRTASGMLLDAATLDEIDVDAMPRYFGHGTMVAGLVRLVAPSAKIMPLRAFDATGRAHPFDVVRAIYHAVDHGADVINMSFSMPELSKELQRAIQYARGRGVVCVAAAGNQGQQTHVYPAALSGSAGVAATTLDDELSGFSNRGSSLVSLAAPGAGVISTYPGDLYAAGWGTSFASPLVAGTAALVYLRAPGSGAGDVQRVMQDLARGAVRLPALAGEIGSGRLDVLGTVLAASD